jgi:hypothetical protein
MLLHEHCLIALWPFSIAWTTIGDQDIRLCQQRVENFTALVRAIIQSDTAFVAVNPEKLAHCMRVDVRWTEGAKGVSTEGLDFDHVRSHVGEEHGAERAGAADSRFDDGDPVQRLQWRIPFVVSARQPPADQSSSPQAAIL